MESPLYLEPRAVREDEVNRMCTLQGAVKSEWGVCPSVQRPGASGTGVSIRLMGRRDESQLA